MPRFTATYTVEIAIDASNEAEARRHAEEFRAHHETCWASTTGYGSAKAESTKLDAMLLKYPQKKG